MQTKQNKSLPRQTNLHIVPLTLSIFPPKGCGQEPEDSEVIAVLDSVLPEIPLVFVAGKLQISRP